MSLNTGNYSSPILAKFHGKLLSTPQAMNIYGMFANEVTLGSRESDTIRMRRVNRLATATVPLGATMNNPPSQLMTKVDIDAKVEWYATYLVITKQVTLINVDPVLNEATARLGQSLRETEDELIREMLLGGASQINCVYGVSGDNPTEITRTDIDGIVAALQGSDCDFMTNMIGAENKFGTAAVRDAYFLMANTDMIGQFEAVSGFIPKAQYPNQNDLNSSEWGSISNTRIYLSSRGSVTKSGSALGADIYNMFIGGQESYTKIKQNAASSAFIYHPPGHGDDPCELRQTAGWRMAQVPKITNDSWILNLRATLA